MRVSSSLQPYQHLISVVLLKTVLLRSVRWSLSVVLMCISLIVMLSVSSGACWPSVCLWKNAYSDPLLIFKLVVFFFFFFLTLRCVNYLSVLDINSFTDLSFAKAFSHSLGVFYSIIIVIIICFFFFWGDISKDFIYNREILQIYYLLLTALLLHLFEDIFK